MIRVALTELAGAAVLITVGAGYFGALALAARRLGYVEDLDAVTLDPYTDTEAPRGR